ncbi:hypothetical protein BCR37DRAFT_391184 [Protomyces lactucae-debilis]|uniref:Required for respiratory growth protein 8, mitochondrial n=1 Tax=Protomyces lactucae-debilis TaxID=2754530 RepID=A0A1Y2FR52_PROLT|nr:uncharacterized protein BCR37DRAFT_391184 [Protomyces lactucae-debilis]ORY86409.1 hypothetical protein BCR37DRAFT_391184 [Protomyces lactucae-debilis]
MSSVGPSADVLTELLRPSKLPDSIKERPKQESFIFGREYDKHKGKPRKASLHIKPTPKQRHALAQLSNEDKSRRKQLRDNKHAQILASPVRLCAYTRTRMPRALMIPLSLCPHPSNKDEDWIMPDFERKVPGKHVYVTNSSKILEALGSGKNAWKRLQIEDDEPLSTRKVVWRPDMIEHVKREMVRCKWLVQELYD